MTVSARLSPLFTWRGAIVDADLPATTKHVALTLSLHMNERGGSCFPSIETLATETSLHYDTVRDHLRALAAAGWLSKDLDRSIKGRGTKVTYTAMVPTTVVENTDGENTGVLFPDHRGAEPETTVVQNPAPREGVIEDDKEVASSLHRLHYPEAFEDFYATYERTGPKKKAYECWQQAIKRDTPETILAGLVKWMLYWATPGATAMKWPQGWLNNDTWRDDPPLIRDSGTPQRLSLAGRIKAKAMAASVGDVIEAEAR